MRQKVIADRPAGLGDGCYLSADQRVQAPLTLPASGPCAAQFPVASDPRGVAGAPVSADVLKCRLRPVDARSYRVSLTPAQQSALPSVFPAGVCAYDRPGQGQVPPMGSWLGYGDGSQGTFGHAPAPRPLSRPGATVSGAVRR